MQRKFRRIWIPNNKTKRLFLAIPIPKKLAASLSLYQKYAQDIGIAATVPTRWMPPENFHITVQFIGRVDEKKIPGLIKHIKNFSRTLKPFTLSFDGFVIATPKEPKMIWATFKSTSAFRNLVGLLPHNGHDVIPHVTLARLKGAIQFTGNFPKFSTSLLVDRLILYESKTSPNGSKYRTIAMFPFENRPT